MVIFHFFVSVILVGLGLNRSVESYYRVGLGWAELVPSRVMASRKFLQHTTPGQQPPALTSLYDPIKCLSSSFDEKIENGHNNFPLLSLWCDESAILRFINISNDENDWYLQVYTGGVFSPMSEDGSDYQQMDSFQVVMTLQWWYCWSTSGFEMFRICDL